MPAMRRMTMDELAAGRDRALDAVRALAMLAVAVGHWLGAEPVVTSDGLVVRDVLAALPAAAHLTWIFQVIPLFMVAGFAVGIPSWRRHGERGGTAGSWVARRVWRLLWPTIPVVLFWTLVTQVGDHLLGLDDALLAATRGIGLIVWFLAVYVLLMALLPILDRLARRFGTLRVMVGFGAPALAVDVVASRLGYVSSTEPSWVWVNFVLWWAPIGLAGRWWPYSHERRARRIAAGVAGGALVLLVLVTAAGWYPVAMIGVTGQARSNALPPTLALALLAAVQTGVLFAAAEQLRRRLAARRWYLPVAVAGSRAMTLYLWHPLGPVIATLVLVLPAVWPAPAVGTAAWWGTRLAWVGLNAVIVAPVVWALGRLERPPPTLAVTESAVRCRSGHAVPAGLCRHRDHGAPRPHLARSGPLAPTGRTRRSRRGPGRRHQTTDRWPRGHPRCTSDPRGRTETTGLAGSARTALLTRDAAPDRPRSRDRPPHRARARPVRSLARRLGSACEVVGDGVGGVPV